MSYPESLDNFLKAQLFWELELRDPAADEDDMSEATGKLRRAEEEFIRWLRESEGMECSWFKDFGSEEERETKLFHHGKDCQCPPTTPGCPTRNKT